MCFADKIRRSFYKSMGLKKTKILEGERKGVDSDCAIGIFLPLNLGPQKPVPEEGKVL